MPIQIAKERKWLQRAIVWGGLLILWEIAATHVGQLFLPHPAEVLANMVAVIFNGDLLSIGNSLWQMFIGFFIAVLVGVPLGLLMGSVRWTDIILGLYIRALFMTPLEALLPFMIILFGTKIGFRIAVVFLFALFHIVFNAAASVGAADANLVETAKAFNASRLKILRHIVIPSSLPYLITGLRLGFGTAFKGMVISELWILTGTGKKLYELGTSRALPEFFALAAWIVILGIGLTSCFAALQKALTPWQIDTIDYLQQQFNQNIQ